MGSKELEPPHEVCSGLGARSLRPGIWLALLGVFFFALTGLHCAAQINAKNVLLLDSFTDPDVEVSPLLESTLRAHSPWPLNFYVEKMEGQRLDDNAYEMGVVETVRHAYGAQKLDLVIANFNPALRFALSHREELFPGVPIVFLGINAARLVGQKMWRGVTGVTLIVDVRDTINLALLLHPHTSTIAVVTGSSSFEKYYLEASRAELVRHKDQVKEIDLVGLPTNELLERVAALPAQTVILFQEGPQAAVHPVMGTYDVLAWIGRRLPTYCIWPETCLSHGGIGGATYDLDKQGVLAAGLARRVLSGERPEDIPLANDTDERFGVDWREIHKWNISESALPPGVSVLYRPSSLWEKLSKIHHYCTCGDRRPITADHRIAVGTGAQA